MNSPRPELSYETRQEHLALLRDVTQIPTVAGHEQRVVEYVTRWCAQREDVVLAPDASGNLHISLRSEGAGRPLYFTAHLDHPAFVVQRIVAPDVVELAFRGGVMDDYFVNAPVVVHDAQGGVHKATLFGEGRTGEAQDGSASLFKHYMAEFAHPTDAVGIGDVAVWDVGQSEVQDNCLHAPACDDLAAVAGALCAYDVLRLMPMAERSHPVRLLFTRAEEIGFVGAIAACKHGTMPRDARVIALENSRSFAESPIGGGPIVRVGDRLSIFSPTLTDAVAKRAEEIAGAPMPTAAQKFSEAPSWKWQRKLMAGGACEASVFCTYGYEATCVCLPLGNYHNMADLTAVQAGTNTTPARVAREFISVADFEGLVDLLIACGQRLPAALPLSDRFERLWGERQFVLG
jgi:putative aminopeptidase FrvX